MIKTDRFSARCLVLMFLLIVSPEPGGASYPLATSGAGVPEQEVGERGGAILEAPEPAPEGYGAPAVSYAASGRVFYVRPDGHDSATGLSDSSDAATGAWLTLQHAADVVQAGDTVRVADGEYTGFMIRKGGTADAPIVFQATGSGANIVRRNARTADGINIESYDPPAPDYIVIDGFNVYNQPRMGIRAIGGTGIVIQNCRVYNNADNGIFSGDTPYIRILNNTTYANGSSYLQHNIYLSNALSDNCVIRGNVVHSANAGNGIAINGDYEMGGDGYIDNALVENNIIYRNRLKGLSLLSIRNGRIQNNVIYSNGASAGGIHIVEKGSTYYSVNNVVVNNTIDEPLIAAVRVNANNTGNMIFNNICIGNTGIVFEGSGNYASNNYSSASGSGVFTDFAGHDYRLTEQSPAVSFGLSSFRGAAPPSVDMAGTARPQQLAYDAGAYEYVAPKLQQSINFSIPGLAVGGGSVELVATASSGLPVTITSKTPATCTVIADRVTPVAAGVCTLTASQGGDSVYDAAPEVTASVTVTLRPDSAPPVVAAFTMPSSATSPTVSVTAFRATDDVGATGYLITESATAPAPEARGWSSTPPESFTFAGSGARTAYGWVRDAAGNVSAGSAAHVLVDTALPIIRSMILAVGASAVTVKVSAFDDTGIGAMELYLDDALLLATSGSYFSHVITVPDRGYATITVTLRDTAGNRRSQSLKVLRY